MHFLLAVIAALAIAFTAEAGIAFDPPAPNTHDFVKLVVDVGFWPGSCPPLRAVVTKSERTIDVFWGDTEDCVLLPEMIVGWHEVVPIGVLEAGEYTVRLRGTKGLFRTMSLFVTGAQPDLWVLYPFASTRGDSTLHLLHLDGCDAGFAASVQTVLLDGVSVPFTRTQCGVEVVPPPHAAGLVDIAVVTPAHTFTAPKFLRYVDPGAPPAPDVFTRILVPIVYTGGGRFGSQWVTEGGMFELREKPFQAFHDFEKAACATGTCGGQSPWTAWGSHPRGLVLSVPRAALPLMQYSLRARDVSRPDSSWGAEIPIVGEDDFRDEIFFLPVPFNGRYRLTLRVYSLDGPQFARIYSQGGMVTVPMIERSCGDAALGTEPWYGEVDLLSALPQLAGRPSAPITLEGRDIWGFISVTQNESQHVTVVTPGTKPR